MPCAGGKEGHAVKQAAGPPSVGRGVWRGCEPGRRSPGMLRLVFFAMIFEYNWKGIDRYRPFSIMWFFRCKLVEFIVLLPFSSLSPLLAKRQDQAIDVGKGLRRTV